MPTISPEQINRERTMAALRWNTAKLCLLLNPLATQAGRYFGTICSSQIREQVERFWETGDVKSIPELIGCCHWLAQVRDVEGEEAFGTLYRLFFRDHIDDLPELLVAGEKAYREYQTSAD